MIEFLKENKTALKSALRHTIFGAFVALAIFYFVFHEVPFVKSSIFVACFAVIVAFPQHLQSTLQGEKFRKLSEDMRDLLCRDPLTNVATRRFFFERMQMTPNAHGAVLMVDIDHFKNINDTYGHPTGDEAIRIVASTLTQLCRGQDLVCRFGGEEFAIFIYEVDEDTVEGMAEILRECVAHEPIRHDGNELFANVSIGIAMKAAEDGIDDVIAKADAALYQAKRGGRNRVVFSSAMSSPEAA